MDKMDYLRRCLGALLLVLLSAAWAPGASAQEGTHHEDLFVMVDECLKQKYYDRALRLLDTLSKSEMEEADDTTKLYYNLSSGRVYMFKPDYVKAERHIDEAMSLYEKLRYRYVSYVEILASKAYICDVLGRRAEAAVWYRKALIRGKTLKHETSVDVDNCCYVNLANIYNEAGEYKLASEFYKKVQWQDSLNIVEFHVDHYGKELERYMQYGKSGNWLKAKEVNDSLTNYCRVKYGENHMFYLSCLQNEGTIQGSLNDYAKAAVPYEETIRIGKAYSLQSYDVAYAYCRLVECYCNLDSLDGLTALFPEATAYIKALNDERVSEYEPCLFLSLACVRNRGYNGAIPLLEAFLSHAPKYMQWGVPHAVNKLAWAYLYADKYQEIVDWLSPMLSDTKALPDNFQSVIPQLYKTLGCAYYLLKQRDEAVRNLKEAVRLSNGELENDSHIVGILKELEAL